MSDSWKSQASQIFSRIEHSRHSAPFLYPVDTDAVSDYLALIKNPICLNDIKERMSIYKSRDEFVRDMDLVWENAFSYNAKGTKIYKKASTLKGIYHSIRANLWGIEAKTTEKRRLAKKRRKSETTRPRKNKSSKKETETENIQMKHLKEKSSGQVQGRVVDEDDIRRASTKRKHVHIRNESTTKKNKINKSDYLKGIAIPEPTESEEGNTRNKSSESMICSPDVINSATNDFSNFSTLERETSPSTYSVYTLVDLVSPKKRVLRKRKGRFDNVSKTRSSSTPIPKSSLTSIRKSNYSPGILNEGNSSSTIDLEMDKLATKNHFPEPSWVATSFPAYLKPWTPCVNNSSADVSKPTNERESSRILKEETIELKSSESIARDKSSRSIKHQSLFFSTKEVQPKLEVSSPESPSMGIGISKSAIPQLGSLFQESQTKPVLRVSGMFDSNNFDFIGRGNCVKGEKIINQDRVLLEYCSHMKNLPGILIFGVCDGHGLLGHVAAEFIRSRISAEVLKFLNSRSEQIMTTDLFEEALGFTLKQLNERLRYIIKSEEEAYNQILNRSGCVARPLDYGTTCVVAITDGINLTVANVGDSKIVCYTYANGRQGQKVRGKEPLSVEHSLKNSSERSRIKKSGGKVSDDLRLYPATMQFSVAKKLGLVINMSRALGHPALSKHGLSPTPEFKSMKLDPSTEYFLVAGSDGLWDVISTEEVGEVINEYFIGCAHSQTGRRVEEDILSELVEKANISWQKICLSDDISTIVVSMRNKSNH